MKRMDWFRVGRDLFKGGRTGFGWFQGGKDWFWQVSREEGLVSANFRVGRTSFGWEGVVLGGFGSFRFLVTTINYTLSFHNRRKKKSVPASGYIEKV